MDLEKLLNPKKAALVRFFLENPVLEYTKEDIHELADVPVESPEQLEGSIRVLKNIDVIEETGKHNGERTYKLRPKSDMTNLLGVLRLKLEGELKDGITIRIGGCCDEGCCEGKD